MPRKKIEAPEEELEVKVKQKKETYVVRWFNDYAANNKSELKAICELTMRSAREQFTLNVKSSNSELFAALFDAVFMTILETLRSKQKQYSNFTIEIANSINIGYVNNDNEDNEKIGNFMPIMEYIGINKKVIDYDVKIDPEKSTKNFLSWKSLNIKKNAEYYKDIQELAFQKMKAEYRTDMRTSEAMIPLFCIFMDNIVSVLKVKYKEAQGTDVSEVSINVLGLFDAYYSFDEDDNKEIIEFQPNIRMKLALKSDMNSDKRGV